MHNSNDTGDQKTRNAAKNPLKKILIGVAVTTMMVGLTAGFAFNRGPGHHGMGPFARGQAREFIEYRVEKALDSVDASKEQKLKIKQIVAQLEEEKADMQSLHEQLHQRLQDTLSADVIDREQLEAIRVEIMQHASAKSLRLTQAVGDVADVLTPEQRRALIAQFEAEHQRQ